MVKGKANAEEAARELARLRRELAEAQGTIKLLLALAIQYAEECGECNGTGTLWTSPQDPQDSTEYPCEACANIRAVIDKAEGKR